MITKKIRKSLLAIGTSILLTGGICTLTTTLTSCSKNGLDYSELNKILSKIDTKTVDEEKSQLRGAYTRKLIKEGNPDAISIASAYANEVDLITDDIYAAGGTDLQAFNYVNQSAEYVDVGLMEWDVFSSYRGSFVSKISNEVNNIKGIGKEQKTLINSQMDNWITEEAKTAREQGRSADEFISDFETKISEQISSQTTKNALLAKTGIDISRLAQENVLLPKKEVPNGMDIRNWNVGDDITSALPELFSINTQNTPYTSTSLAGYTGKAEIESITPKNMYTYEIEIKHSICLTDYINQPDYWQSFTCKYTFMNSISIQQQIATELLAEVNLQSKNIDDIVAYNDFIKESEVGDITLSEKALSDVFNFNKDARLLASGDETGFSFKISLTSLNSPAKQVGFTVTISNTDDVSRKTNDINNVQLALTNEEKIACLRQVEENIKKYNKTFNYYSDKNYKTLKDYYDWCTAYAIAETALAAVATGLAATFWLCAFWTAGATITYAIGSTAQAVMSWVAVGFGWSQQVSLGHMVDDFNEVRTPDFIELSKWWNENKDKLTQQSDFIEINLNEHEPNSVRLVYSEVSSWFQLALIPLTQTLPILVLEIMNAVLTFTHQVASLIAFDCIAPTLGEWILTNAPFLVGNFGKTLNDFVWQEANMTAGTGAYGGRLNTVGAAGGTLGTKIGNWFARVTGAVATKESIERAQNTFAWACPIYIITGIVSFGLAIANIVLMFMFRAAFDTNGEGK